MSIWMEMYQRIVAYKKEHDNTFVPLKYEKDRPLGIWVSKQRNIKKNNKMTEERVLLLKSIGFFNDDNRSFKRQIMIQNQQQKSQRMMQEWQEKEQEKQKKRSSQTETLLSNVQFQNFTSDQSIPWLLYNYRTSTVR